MNDMPPLSERVNLEEALACSFRDFHAKGLDYVCLRRSDVETWKLYFFDGDVSSAPEVVYPHDHRYAFDTVVMTGVVENVLYERVKDGGGTRLNRFDWLTPLNGGGGFTFVEECSLAERACRRYRQGDGYRMDHASIHTLRVQALGTVLFLRQYADVVPVGIATSTYCRGDAPKLDGLYRRFDEDSLLARLREFEARSGFCVRSAWPVRRSA